MQTDLEVRGIIQDSRLLRPLLKQHVFEKHFTQMDADNSNVVTWDEFLKFCTSESLSLEAAGKTKKVPRKGHTYTKKRVSMDENRELQNAQDKYRRDQTAIL